MTGDTEKMEHRRDFTKWHKKAKEYSDKETKAIIDRLLKEKGRRSVEK